MRGWIAESLDSKSQDDVMVIYIYIYSIREYKLSVAAVANPSNNLIPADEGEHLIFQSQLTTFSGCFIKGRGGEELPSEELCGRVCEWKRKSEREDKKTASSG